MAVDERTLKVLERFREYVPEFNNVDDAEVTRMIEVARRIHDKSILATVYCAAHAHVVLGMDAATISNNAGVVTSEQVGPMSRSYDHGRSTQGESDRGVYFQRTKYGRLFLGA